MKNYFLFPYRCRYVGWCLVAAHIPVAMIGHGHGLNVDSPLTNGELFSGGHLFFVCTALLMAAGLFLVAFAKEKIEDEQIWQIRLDSLRQAIYINYIMLIICLLFFNDTEHILELNLWVPLIFFIIRFRWAIFRLNRSLKFEELHEK